MTALTEATALTEPTSPVLAATLRHVSAGHHALADALEEIIEVIDEAQSGDLSPCAVALTRVIRSYIEDHLPVEARLLGDLLGPTHPAYHHLEDRRQQIWWQVQYLLKMVGEGDPRVDPVVLHRQSRKVKGMITGCASLWRDAGYRI